MFVSIKDPTDIFPQPQSGRRWRHIKHGIPGASESPSDDKTICVHCFSMLDILAAQVQDIACDEVGSLKEELGWGCRVES